MVCLLQMSSEIEFRDQQNIIQNSNLIIIYATFLPCLCNDTNGYEASLCMLLDHILYKDK